MSLMSIRFEAAIHRYNLIQYKISECNQSIFDTFCVLSRVDISQPKSVDEWQGVCCALLSAHCVSMPNYYRWSRIVSTATNAWRVEIRERRVASFQIDSQIIRLVSRLVLTDQSLFTSLNYYARRHATYWLRSCGWSRVHRSPFSCLTNLVRWSSSADHQDIIVNILGDTFENSSKILSCRWWKMFQKISFQAFSKIT